MAQESIILYFLFNFNIIFQFSITYHNNTVIRQRAQKGEELILDYENSLLSLGRFVDEKIHYLVE